MAEAEAGTDSNIDEEERTQKVFRFLRDTSASSTSNRGKCTFKVIPSRIGKIKSDLEDLIYLNGGDVLDLQEGLSADDDHVVTVLNEKYYFENPEENCILPFDTYTSVYIYDAVRSQRNKEPIPNLTNYRLTESKFKPYDANKILFQETKWSDLIEQRRRHQTNVRPTAQQAISKFKAILHNPESVNQSKQQEVQGRIPEEALPDSSKSPSPIRRRHRRIVSSDSSSSSNKRDSVLSEEETTDHVLEEHSPAKKQKLDSRTRPLDKDKRTPQKNTENNEPHRSKSPPRSRQNGHNNNGSTKSTPSPDRSCTSGARNSQSRSASKPKETRAHRSVSPPPLPTHSPGNGRMDTGSDNENAVVNGNGKSTVSNSPRVRSSPADNRNKELRGAQGHAIKIVPHPRTNATFKSPLPLNLVPRAFAGPSTSRSKNGPSRQAQTVDRAQAPIVDNNAETSDGWLSCDEVSYNEDDDAASTISNESGRSSTSRILLRRGLPFSLDEGQSILNLICENNAFMYTKGNKLWELIEDSGRFRGRTKQSMKEHFRKKVLPNALNGRLYKISPEHLKRLKKAQERANWTKHANVCPDYKF